MKKKNGFLILIFFLYIAILFRITVFRSGVSPENGTIHLIPFVDFLSVIKQGGWLLFCYLFFGNLIWFVPFGSYCLVWKPKMSLFQIGVLGFLLSFLIESLQYLLQTGRSEVDDLILNTLGALIGGAIMKFLRRKQKNITSHE